MSGNLDIIFRISIDLYKVSKYYPLGVDLDVGLGVGISMTIAVADGIPFREGYKKRVAGYNPSFYIFAKGTGKLLGGFGSDDGPALSFEFVKITLLELRLFTDFPKITFVPSNNCRWSDCDAILEIRAKTSFSGDGLFRNPIVEPYDWVIDPTSPWELLPSPAESESRAFLRYPNACKIDALPAPDTKMYYIASTRFPLCPGCYHDSDTLSYVDPIKCPDAGIEFPLEGTDPTEEELFPDVPVTSTQTTSSSFPSFSPMPSVSPTQTTGLCDFDNLGPLASRECYEYDIKKPICQNTGVCVPCNEAIDITCADFTNALSFSRPKNFCDTTSGACRAGPPFYQEKKLTTSPFEGEHFGSSGKICNNHAIITAEDENGDDVFFFYQRVGKDWAFSRKFDNIAIREQFGSFGNIAFECFQSTILIANGGVQAPYVFLANQDENGAWNIDSELRFGGNFPSLGRARSLALSADFAILGIGAIGDPSIYVFAKNNGVWDQGTRITAPPDSNSYYFGRSVALDGNWILVGDPKGYYVDGILRGIGVYSYEFDFTSKTWQYRGSLIPDPTVDYAYDDYASTFDIKGDIAVVCSKWKTTRRENAAYVFKLGDSGSWIYDTQLFYDEPLTAFDGFDGDTLKLSENTVIIGAVGDLRDNVLSYKVPGFFVFKRDVDGIWNSGKKVTAYDGFFYDGFGIVADISEEYLLIGAPNDYPYYGPAIKNARGSAYVFNLTLIPDP